MTEIPKVRNTVARQIFQELSEAGIAAEPLLKEAGLQTYQINREDGWVSFESHARLLEAASREFADPYFGLHLVKRIDPRDYGALAYVGLSSKTLHDALLNLERYLTVQTEAWNFDVMMEQTAVVLQITPHCSSFDGHTQAAEAAVGTLIYAYQFFLGEPLAPLEVRFVHSTGPSRQHSRYEELLGCPVKFTQNRCQIVLDRKSLSLPIGTADDRLLKILKSYCEHVLEQHKLAHSDLVAKVKQTIVELLPSGRAKAKLVAGELGMTERTMHRRLADEDTSFTKIHERLRRGLAEKYIAEHKLSLQQVAFVLGYADQSAFSVAFKRWTGRSPTEVRAGIQ
ncbi:MAG: AraC family transcriptional regulator [Rhizobiales bacterium]|nr:AraC family transcriptional regulator [Hyphomicrobiales bacterium]